MFLVNLSEKEKQLFLQASLHISHSDEKFSDEEKLVIVTLCQEMAIPVSYELTQSLDEVLNELKQIASPPIKRSIVFELAGVIMADEVYADSEKALMARISDALGVDIEVSEESVRLITQMSEIYKSAAKLIRG